MKSYFERMRRAIWSYKQPLTHAPAISGAPVSDLFVWRNSDEWETFFELTDLPALFEEVGNVGRNVTLVFFNALGQLLLQQTIPIIPGRRNTLAIASFIDKTSYGETGTFSVFHTHTPQSLQALGSHLAERGYVSYRYRKCPLRAYVHGNLDAIARMPDKRLQLLGGYSISTREYNLQHALSLQSHYELVIINSTPKEQRIVCRTFSASGKLHDSQTASLRSRGSHLFKVMGEYEQQRIIISSRLIMARPLVFCIKNQTMDVFHG